MMVASAGAKEELIVPSTVVFQNTSYPVDHRKSQPGRIYAREQAGVILTVRKVL